MIQAALGLVPLQKIFPNKIVSILCKEKKNCKIMQTTKKKYTQNDLRRLMSEQKAKAAPKVVQNKIDSPLAKYNDLGQLMCILCKSVVRSEDVWKVHINAKQHKQNLELAKQLKEKTNNFTTPREAVKRPATAPLPDDTPFKQPKSILKNAINQKSSTPTTSGPTTSAESTKATSDKTLPTDFFDTPTQSKSNYFEATLKKTNIKSELMNFKRAGNDANNASKESHDADIDQSKSDTAIPEGFFDDPIKDAKARQTEYKDPVEEEWEKFQVEIKEASNFSNAIMAEEQEEAITERQIDEIDEQMRNWNRVLEMEKMKEDVDLQLRTKDEDVKQIHEKDNSDDSDDDNSEIDEFLDWRSKKAFK